MATRRVIRRMARFVACQAATDVRQTPDDGNHRNCKSALPRDRLDSLSRTKRAALGAARGLPHADRSTGASAEARQLHGPRAVGLRDLQPCSRRPRPRVHTCERRPGRRALGPHCGRREVPGAAARHVFRRPVGGSRQPCRRAGGVRTGPPLSVMRRTGAVRAWRPCVLSCFRAGRRYRSAHLSFCLRTSK